MTALLRAHRVVSQLGLHAEGRLERAPSVANEVWYAGDVVVRLSASRGTRRLEYETAVAQALPAGAHYPDILSYGRADFAEWLVLRRMPGQALSRAWVRMRDTDRREAMRQLAAAMRLVHTCEGPIGPDGPIRPPFLDGDSLECPHQLPVSRLLTLIDRCRPLPNVDPGVLRDAARIVELGAPALDTEVPRFLIHGDLHFENILWDGDHITAVLDFEFARRGPADLDLEVLLRFLADPELHVAADYEQLTNRDQYRRVPAWLREDYPELFAHPRLADRLTVYGLAYDIRQVLLQPPLRPADDLPTYHPYNRVRRTVDGRSHLQWMEF